MTAQLYPNWKRALLDGQSDASIIDNATTGPYVALINTTTGSLYTFLNSHQFYNVGSSPNNAFLGTVGSGASGPQRITPTATFVGTTPGAGDAIFDGGDVTFTSVTGATASALIIYRASATANSTWRLMSYYDTPGGGLPVVPNSGNISIQWNSGGIFQLSDANWKHDIRRIGNIGRLPLYEYMYRMDESPREVGFMAQEVETLAPEAVIRHSERRYVNYERAICRAIQ
jgi:Chaperone of endosialidase